MMVGKDGESPETEIDGEIGGNAGGDEGGAATEGNDDHVKDDQKPAT